MGGPVAKGSFANGHGLADWWTRGHWQKTRGHWQKKPWPSKKSWLLATTDFSPMATGFGRLVDSWPLAKNWPNNRDHWQKSRGHWQSCHWPRVFCQWPRSPKRLGGYFVRIGCEKPILTTTLNDIGGPWQKSRGHWQLSWAVGLGGQIQRSTKSYQ